MADKDFRVKNGITFGGNVTSSNNGFVFDYTANTLTINGTVVSGGGGGNTASNSFTTISVSGQSDIVADSSTDTLTFVAGSGIQLTTDAASDTLTISSIGPRLVYLADATSITVDVEVTDVAQQNNTQAVGTLTVNAPTGTIFDSEKFILRINSTNVQTLSWNGVFAGSTDGSLPTATTGSDKTDYMGFMYMTADSKWHMIAKNFGF